MNDIDILSKLTMREHTIPLKYLKWQDDVIATIENDGSVNFLSPNFNSVVRLTTNGRNHWTPAEFRDFE